ncbi:MAG: hypothetical protein HY730_06155, partial [Candidatus Tectomicrobia bacterium]|nr:hypothetical protein [Candidatus Tectomicrobia bacterium]
MKSCGKITKDQKSQEPFLPEERQVLVHGGAIYTLDENNPKPEALVIERGRVVAAGDRKSMRDRAGADAIDLELQGYVAMPGLVDTHPHLLHYGIIEEPLVDVVDAKSHDDIVGR